MADRNKELYLAELAEITHCTAEEMTDLMPKAASGDEAAYNRLTEGNLYRVCEAASFFSGPHVRFMDLVQEGNLALLMKLKELTSYEADTERMLDDAIRQAMENYKAEETDAYRAGIELKTKLNVMDRICQKIAEEEEREATAEEIAELMKLEVDDVKYLMRIALDALNKED